MYTGLVFIGYVAAVCLCIVGIMLPMLIFLKRRNSSSVLFRAVSVFAFLILAMSLLYFYFYCRQVVLNKDEGIGGTLRAFDYLLCAALLCSWVNVMSELLGGNRLIRVSGYCIAAASGIGGAAISIIYADKFYGISNEGVASFFSVFEIVLYLMSVIVIVKALYEFLRNEAMPYRRVFAVLNSAFMILWFVNQAVIDIGLYRSRFGISAWDMQVADPTSLLMIFMALVTMVFIFMEDFSPLFLASADKSEAVDIVEKIAIESRLTQREAETMSLVYEGYSNPEIAEQMFISISTVKKHLRSVYIKVGVSTRMELVQFLNYVKEIEH